MELQGAKRFHPALFPSVENDCAVPSVQHHLRRCHRFWRQTKKALLRTAEQNIRTADRHRSPAPTYRVGQKLWLSTKDIQLNLKTTKKLSPGFRTLLNGTHNQPFSGMTHTSRIYVCSPHFSCFSDQASRRGTSLPYYQAPPTHPDHRQSTCLHRQSDIGHQKTWKGLTVPGGLGVLWSRRALLGS